MDVQSVRLLAARSLFHHGHLKDTLTFLLLVAFFLPLIDWMPTDQGLLIEAHFEEVALRTGAGGGGAARRWWRPRHSANVK